MKHLIGTIIIVLFFFSCRKEMNLPANDSLNSSNLFIQRVKAQLKDSLSASDYASIDTNQLYKSKDPHSNGYFMRGAFQKKVVATDFILLKTDSLGNIWQGRIVHVNKAKSNQNMDNTIFHGLFAINSLDKSHSIKRDVIRMEQ